jgi:hypothetical protein
MENGEIQREMSTIHFPKLKQEIAVVAEAQAVVAVELEQLLL